MREPSVTETATPDNQRPEPLRSAAACAGLGFENVQGGSKEPPDVGLSYAITSSQTQQPGAMDADAFTSSSSPGLSSSPTPLETRSTHSVEDLFGAYLTRPADAAHDTSFQDAASQPDKELVGLYGSGPDRESRSPASPKEKPLPRKSPLYLDSASQPEKRDEQYPLSHKASKSRPRHRTQPGQQRTRTPDRFPAAPATTQPRRLPGLVRAVQQDKPRPQDGASAKAKQMSPFQDTATKTAHSTLPVVETPLLLNPIQSAVPFPQPENGARRENRPTRVSPSRGSRNDEASSPIVKRNGTPRSAAVRHGIRDCVAFSDVSDSVADADCVQQHLADEDTFPQRHKRRRPSSQRAIGTRRQDAEESHSSFEDSGDEWVLRPPKRRRVKPTRPMTARRQISSNSGNIRSEQVQTAQSSGLIKSLSAKLAECLFETADVRSAIVDGMTIFQLRFKEDLYCSKHRHAVLNNPGPVYASNSPAMRSNSKRGLVPSGDFTPDEHSSFSPMENDVEAPPLAETEWEIEGIVGKKRRGAGWQVCVKWANFEKVTWEPRTNFLGTEALVAYEAEHG